MEINFAGKRALVTGAGKGKYLSNISMVFLQAFLNIPHLIPAIYFVPRSSDTQILKHINMRQETEVMKVIFGLTI